VKKLALGFLLVLISVAVSQAETDFPIAGPTLRPAVQPSPAFRVFYESPTVPAPSPSPTLTVQPAPVVSAPVPISSPSVTPAPVVVAPVSVRPKLLPPITISVFGGGDFISFSEVNNLVGTSLFQSMIYYGAELRYPITYEFSLLLRGERMSKGSSVGAASFSLSSIPVMAGIDFHSHHQRKLRFHISALVGPALNTNLTETASSLPSPNVTEFSSSALSEMLRMSLEYPLAHTVGIFVEGGYRFLKTSSIAPSPTGSGSTVFQSNGQYQSVPLNLNGPFVGGGLVFVL
jgi:hypothetical protein